MKLKTTAHLVRDILYRKPFTRNSDEKLYIEVVRGIDRKAATMPFWYVLEHRKDFGLPSLESVGRCRRKVVEKNPELAGTDKVEGFRAMEEQEYREWARGE